MQADPVVQQAVDHLYEKLEHPGLEQEITKITRKFQEARYNPGDIHPLADCMLAILMAAKNAGFTVDMVFEALERLARDTMSKDWKKMPDGTYQSIDS